MTRPADIPQDIWDAAWADYFARCDSASKLAADFEEDEVIDLLCRARLAERKRCADVVRGYPEVIPMWSRGSAPPGNGTPRRATQAELAAAILDGSA